MFFAQEDKQIGPYTYKVTQLDAIQGIEVLTRFINIVGPALASADEKDAGASVAKALAGLSTKLTADDVKYFVGKFSKLTSVSGGDLKVGHEPQLDAIFSAHFAGRYLDMFKWLAFCFEVNFRSFFSEGGASLGGLLGRLASA
jgi:hypothetical protein